MPTPPDIDIEVFGKTDVGLIREHNEDNFLVADVTGSVRAADGRAPFTFKLGEKGALFLVCDGMGGAAAGEVAAQMAADAIYESLTAAEPQPRDGFARLLRRAVQRANERIFIQSRDNQSERGMGTTCTAAALVDETLVVAQIGDSRCYVLRDGKLAQVTKDQSLAWQLIEAGAMTAEEAKAFEHANIILQALGVQETVEVVLSQVSCARGTSPCSARTACTGRSPTRRCWRSCIAEHDLGKAGDGLIQKALDRDGPDNITVVLARFDGSGAAAGQRRRGRGVHRLRSGQRPRARADGQRRQRQPRQRDRRRAAAARHADGGRRSDQGGPAQAGRRAAGSRRAHRPGGRQRPPPPRATRSLLALFFLALVAAAAGGIFVTKCESDPSARSDGRAMRP